jgi:hypothetical protein
MNCRSKMTKCFLKMVFLSLVFMLACQVTVVLAANVSFGPPMQFATGTGPCRVGLADFNVDGKLDVVTADYGPYSGGASVLLGNGIGLLTPPMHYSLYYNVTPRALATGDFNGDGKPDFAVGDYDGSNISIFLSSNDPSGFTRTHFPADHYGAYWIAVGDLNGDGKIDIVMANLYYSRIWIYLNNTPTGSSMAMFSYSITTPGGTNPNTVNMGDVNGDGKLDLVISNSNNVKVFLGDGNGAFSTSNLILSFGASGSLLSDVNGDGKLDIVASVTDGVIVMFGNGNGTFGAPTTYNITGVSMFPIIADLNGDGKMDIAVGTSAGYVKVLLGNGSGTFADPFSFLAGGYYVSAIAAGDFNGDGKLDLIAATETRNSVFILLNTTPPANHSPIANAGPNQTISAGANGQANITLDGTGSADPDEDTLTYTWSGAFGTASGGTPTVSLGVGTHTITLTVDDGRGGTASATVEITVKDTTPPVIGPVNNLTVEATSPTGAVVTFDLPMVTDNVDPSPQIVAVVPASGSIFLIGTTTVTLTASDASGNTSNTSFTVTVLSASQMTSNLIATVTNIFPQASGLLENALSSLSKGNTGAACNQVKAFVNQVEAQSGKKLTVAQANQLITSANRIRSTLGCL